MPHRCLIREQMLRHMDATLPLYFRLQGEAQDVPPPECIYVDWGGGCIRRGGWGELERAGRSHTLVVRSPRSGNKPIQVFHFFHDTTNRRGNPVVVQEQSRPRFHILRCTRANSLGAHRHRDAGDSFGAFRTLRRLRRRAGSGFGSDRQVSLRQSAGRHSRRGASTCLR